jgi:hypothetical protein
LQTHQFKPRQSRRKYRAVEAADLVVLLHVTRALQAKQPRVKGNVAKRFASNNNKSSGDDAKDQSAKRTNPSAANAAGNAAPSSLAMALLPCMRRKTQRKGCIQSTTAPTPDP